MSTAAEINEPREYAPVISRVSWGAILAGTAVTFALYILLNLLGVAIGLSVADNARDIGTGAAIWAIIAFMISLFIGGWVTSRFTVGEDMLEALCYGAIVWGVTFAAFLWLLGSGLGLGFSALVGMSANPNVQAQGFTDARLQTLGQEAGLEQAQIKQLQDAAHARQVDQETMARAAWWAFLGTILTMAAAIGGTLAGASPRYRGARMGERFAFRTRRPAAGPG